MRREASLWISFWIDFHDRESITLCPGELPPEKNPERRSTSHSKMTPLAYVSGRFLPVTEASVSITDAGVVLVR